MFFRVQEYNVRSQPVSKQHFIGRFLQGLPSFSNKKKSAGSKWSLQREGLQGRQLTEALKVQCFCQILVTIGFRVKVVF